MKKKKVISFCCLALGVLLSLMGAFALYYYSDPAFLFYGNIKPYKEHTSVQTPITADDIEFKNEQESPNKYNCFSPLPFVTKARLKSHMKREGLCILPGEYWYPYDASFDDIKEILAFADAQTIENLTNEKTRFTMDKMLEFADIPKDLNVGEPEDIYSATTKALALWEEYLGIDASGEKINVRYKSMDYGWVVQTVSADSKKAPCALIKSNGDVLAVGYYSTQGGILE